MEGEQLGAGDVKVQVTRESDSGRGFRRVTEEMRPAVAGTQRRWSWTLSWINSGAAAAKAKGD